MTNHLIIGTGSLIGGALQQKLKAAKTQVSGTNKDTLDLAADPETWKELPKVDIAHICAAVSKLDACEKEPVTAYKVNVAGTTALVKKLAANGTFPLFLSTNHVFDGKTARRNPGDIPSPINEYGRQKMEAERAVLAANGAVLRIAKVISKQDPRIHAWKEALKAGEKITAFSDIFLSPITLDITLDAMLMVAEARKSGIYQISGTEDFSYYDLARAIARYLKVDEALVERGSGAANGVPTSFRPRYSTYAQTLPTTIKVPDIDGIVEYALDKG